jgi:hypothetical protein
MVRLVPLTLGAALLYASGAHAHGTHTYCAVGDSWMGVVPHYHSGGNAGAADCQTGAIADPSYGQPPPRDYYGRGYYEAPPPPPNYYGNGYHRRGYGGRPGDYGPQTNRAQDCYNIHGNRICCPKGWTVQGGQCAPYRGR